MTSSIPMTTIRVPQAVVGAIRIIADAHERSISAEIRVALDSYVDSELEDAGRILRERRR